MFVPEETITGYNSGAFRDKLLHSPDVCSNCFALLKQERIDPVRWSQDRELDSTYERVLEQTEVGYHATHSVQPTQAKEVYCRCGTADAHDRYWSAEDVDAEKFRELLRAVIRTAEAKGISFRRKTAAEYALQRHKDTGEVDAALALGLDAAMHAEVAKDD
jgi:hypothetical protein